jgi:Core-2/I-Branching enzyme
VKLAFAFLAHGNPRLVERLIWLLVGEGHFVALHYDRKSPAADYERLVRTFADCDAVRFARRVRVRWAEWSIPAATLHCLDAIDAAGWEPDYVYLLSGMDYPIRSSAELLAFLDRHRGTEFIESVPADRVRWARTGPQEERYQYRFLFNWRDQPRRFALFLALQKTLRLKRKFVRGMTPYIGSQWWVLTWPTLQKVRALARERDIARFFRTTLVPDELFFQTLVRHLVPHSRISNRILTLYQFSDYGIPVVYYRDHLDYLLKQPFFMARKLSPHGDALRDTLDEYWHGEHAQPPVDDATVGKRGTDYETHRLTYRDGAPGRPVAGRPLRRWYGELERLPLPYFAVIGSSAAELGLVHRLLSRHPELRCHGQLFHKRRIEFAEGRASFAGYPTQAVRLRAVAKANFLADVVRAEKERLSGLMLLWGQGGEIMRLLFERPGARLLLLQGDPIIAFSEEILGRELLIDEPYDPSALEAIPPSLLAARFRQFLKQFRRYRGLLKRQAKKAQSLKPAGWISEIGLAPPGGPFEREQGGASATLAGRSRNRAARLEKALYGGFARHLEAIAGRAHELALLRPPAPSPPLQSWQGERPANDELPDLSRLTPGFLALSETMPAADLSAELARLEERRRVVLSRLLIAHPAASAPAAADRAPQIAALGD